MSNPTAASSTTQRVLRRGTVVPDQVDDLLQERVFLLDGKLGRKCLCDKAADILVNAIPSTRSNMGTHDPQSGVFRHNPRG